MSINIKFKMVVLFFSLLGLVSNIQAAKIVDLKLSEQSGSVRSNVYKTFGHLFKAGDVPAGSTVSAKLLGGSVVPMQLDKKAFHSDGSLRHGVITMKVDELTANELKVISLYSAGSSVVTNKVKLSDLLASGFESKAVITEGGKVYTSSARTALLDGAVSTWLEGQYASEWLVKADLKDGNGNTHPHLIARYHIRAYEGLNNIRIDVVIENNWAYVSGPQNRTYDVDLSVNGELFYRKTSLLHYRQARWHKVFWTNELPNISIIYDTVYVADTRAFPNYDSSIAIDQAALEGLASNLVASNTGPMGISIMTAAMPGTGARADIGPMPMYSAMYLMSMDERAYDSVMAVGDAGGSWSIHYRDEKTDLPILLDDYPYATLKGRASDTRNPATGLRENFPTCGGSCATPYQHDSAHQPSIAYLPYILTGDFFYLEELIFWANFNLIEPSPHYRGFEKGLVKWNQVRGQAWTLRTLGQAVFIVPDSHPMKGYFSKILEYNMDWFNTTYVNNVNANKLGVINNGYAIVYDSGLGLAPWQDDFFTWSVGYLVALGVESAKPLLEWKAQFPIGRMNGPGYCWVLGAVYSMIVRDAKTSPIYSNVAQAYDATVAAKHASVTGLSCGSQEMANALGKAKGEMPGYAASATGYPSNLQPALAVSAESQNVGGSAAWAVFESRAVKPDYSKKPQWAIVPYTGTGETPPPVDILVPSVPTSLKLIKVE